MSTPDGLTTPWQQYDFRLPQYKFMKPQGEHMPVTEGYVAIPPALWIRDEQGALWTLGFDYDEVSWRTGKWSYDVVRNGEKTGEFARHIEYRNNSYGVKTVRISEDGRSWKYWSNGQFV